MQLTHNVSYFRKPHPKGEYKEDLWFELPVSDSDQEDPEAQIGGDSTDEST